LVGQLSDRQVSEAFDAGDLETVAADGFTRRLQRKIVDRPRLGDGLVGRASGTVLTSVAGKTSNQSMRSQSA
jgi:hypothetical protein